MQLSQVSFAKMVCNGIAEASHAGGVFDRKKEKKRLARLQAELKSNLNVQQGSGTLAGDSTSFAGTTDEGG